MTRKKKVVQRKQKAASRTIEKSLEKVLKKAHKQQYVLRLYITGMTARSAEAVATIKSICEENLPGRYDLEVIDIYQYPQLAKDEQIIAAPTLVKKLPEPLRRFIGNLSNEERVLLGLDLRRKT
jgi:circadian clock protein KaiB